MPLYNVTRLVIANVEADTPEAAEKLLAASLEGQGFDAYDPHQFTKLDAFPAETGTEPTRLP